MDDNAKSEKVVRALKRLEGEEVTAGNRAGGHAIKQVRHSFEQLTAEQGARLYDIIQATG